MHVQGRRLGAAVHARCVGSRACSRGRAVQRSGRRFSIRARRIRFWSSARRACASPTLMTCLRASIRPTEGTIDVRGQRSPGEVAGRHRRGVPGGRLRFPCFSRDNIAFGLRRRRRCSLKRNAALLRHRLHGPADFAAAYPAQLSGACLHRSASRCTGSAPAAHPCGRAVRRARPADSLLMVDETAAAVRIRRHCPAYRPCADEPRFCRIRVCVMSSRRPRHRRAHYHRMGASATALRRLPAFGAGTATLCRCCSPRQ